MSDSIAKEKRIVELMASACEAIDEVNLKMENLLFSAFEDDAEEFSKLALRLLQIVEKVSEK